MASRPLGYESLKSVLEYMDANLRFQLFKRVPSIRNVERIVPLKIESLSFGHQEMSVNGTVYKIGIYKEYPSSEVVPGLVTQLNDYGGLSHDIDHLGFEDYSTNGILTPGDFTIQYPRVLTGYADLRDRQEEEKRNVIQYIEDEEKRLERVEKNWTLDINIPKGQRDSLEPYYHLRDGTVPKYESLIQLTMKSHPTESTIGIERVKYNRKLYEAQKYLSNVFFEGRKANMRVKCLWISHSGQGIIRFPIGLKMKVRQLNIGQFFVLRNEKLMSIIDDSSYPLQQIRIESIPDGFKSPIIDTAQRLALERAVEHQNALQVVLNSSHKKFEGLQFGLTAEELFVIVQNWLESNREVGTEYVFIIVPHEVVADFLRIVTERIYGAVALERSITISMKNEAELKISSSTDPRYPWSSIKMEVRRTIEDVQTGTIATS